MMRFDVLSSSSSPILILITKASGLGKASMLYSAYRSPFTIKDMQGSGPYMH